MTRKSTSNKSGSSSSKTKTKSRRSTSSKSPGFQLDELFAYLVFASAALGTWSLPTSVRLAILWTVILLLWLLLREGQRIQMAFSFRELGIGAGIGAAIGLPLLLLTHNSLRIAVPILYIGAVPTAPMLSELHVIVTGGGDVIGSLAFVSLVLLAPLAEGLFFRDIVHRQRGFLIAIGLYALSGMLLFLPATNRFWAVWLAVSGATAVLGTIYGFCYERFGLAVSIAAQMTIHLFLLFIPIVIQILAGQ